MPLNQRSYGRTSPAALLAYQTAAQLRVALGKLGFDPDYDFPALHGDTTVSEEPFVTFGRCNIDVVQRLIALLQAHSRPCTASGAPDPAAAPQGESGE